MLYIWYEELDCDIVLVLGCFLDCLILFVLCFNKILIVYIKKNISLIDMLIVVIFMVESLFIIFEKINKYKERLFNICFIEYKF